MSENPNLASVRSALEGYVDPYLGEALGGAVRAVAVGGAGYVAQLALGFPVGGYHAELVAALQQHLHKAGIDPGTPDLMPIHNLAI